MNEKQVAELFIEQNVLQPSQIEDVLTEVRRIRLERGLEV